VNDERLGRVRECGPFLALATSRKRKDTAGAEAEIAAGKKLQEAIIKALQPLASLGLIKNRDAFASRVRKPSDVSG